MQRLSDLEAQHIARGAVFRVKGVYPYEEMVDLMLVETAEADNPLGVMVATGYSAGHIFVYLPYEALAKNTRMLSTAWIKLNWQKWIYPHCPAEDVIFLERYPAPIAIAE